MNDTNYPLLALFTECETKVAILTLLDRDHELTQYDAKKLSLGEHSRLLGRFMKRFCVGVENPAMPNQYELFTALRAYVAALDDAILTDLLQSLDTVLSQGVTLRDPGRYQLAIAYKAFLRAIDGITLVQQSTSHIGRS